MFDCLLQHPSITMATLSGILAFIYHCGLSIELRDYSNSDIILWKAAHSFLLWRGSLSRR